MFLKLSWMRFILLSIWVILSLSLHGSAGDSAVYGILRPIGPSFMAGDYVRFGFWTNDIEIYAILFWFFGLFSFFLIRIFLLSYFIILIVFQAIFIHVVGDDLLTFTGGLVLIPMEMLFLYLIVITLKKSEGK